MQISNNTNGSYVPPLDVEDATPLDAAKRLVDQKIGNNDGVLTFNELMQARETVEDAAAEAGVRQRHDPDYEGLPTFASLFQDRAAEHTGGTKDLTSTREEDYLLLQMWGDINNSGVGEGGSRGEVLPEVYTKIDVDKALEEL